MSDVLLENTPDNARQMWDVAEAMLPAEKAEYEKRGLETKIAMEKAGSLRIDGTGQLIAKIPLGLYIRWQQEFPGCWQDEGFVKAFLKDNPIFAAPTKNVMRNSIIV